MDPLADVMDVSRVRGAMLANVRARAPWGLALPQSAGASFHAVTSGTAWLRVDGAEPRPADARRPAAACRPASRTGSRRRRTAAAARSTARVKERLMTADGDLAARRPGGRDDVRVRRLRLRPRRRAAAALAPAGRPARARRPRRRDADRGGGVAARRRARDARCRRPRRRRAADRPAAHPRRSRVERERRRRAALVAARAARPRRWRARSPRCTSAPPSRGRSSRLAAEVHLSRATLARRFTELVGEPPLTYLTRWRMDLAARRLKDTTDPVETIARGVGYTSEYAFNRAFSRHRGQPPGRYRRAA